MDAFVVSALKYRPTSFSEVIGQQSITQTLENSLKNNQLAQALLFCGPRGVGKTSCARILAKQINGQEANSSEDFAFNIFELDAASNNSVEDIRKINEQVRIPPQVGSHKIYIIDEAHMLSNAAFNAFLKTLEEPPKHAIFILATTEKNKIIPTVLSRCQVYDFNRIEVKEIQKFLVKIATERNLQFEENALYLIAQKAEGALRDALSIFDRMVSFTQGNLSAKAVADNLNLLDHQTYSALGKLLFQNDIPKILTAYDDLIKRGIDSIQFIKGLADHFRNLMLAKDPKTVALMEVGESVKADYLQDTETLSASFIMDSIALINTCEINFKSVKNKRVHVELTLMQLASLHYNGEKKKDT
ncbi:MAG: DNA polymerase III subunit gamma/tau [Flavobacteriaceae bacterium]